MKSWLKYGLIADWFYSVIVFIYLNILSNLKGHEICFDRLLSSCAFEASLFYALIGFIIAFGIGALIGWLIGRKK